MRHSLAKDKRATTKEGLVSRRIINQGRLRRQHQLVGDRGWQNFFEAPQGVAVRCARPRAGKSTAVPFGAGLDKSVSPRLVSSTKRGQARKGVRLRTFGSQPGKIETW